MFSCRDDKFLLICKSKLSRTPNRHVTNIITRSEGKTKIINTLNTYVLNITLKYQVML